MADLEAIRKKLEESKAARDKAAKSAAQAGAASAAAGAAQTRRAKTPGSAAQAAVAKTASSAATALKGGTKKSAGSYTRKDGGSYAGNPQAARSTNGREPHEYTPYRQKLVTDTLQASRDALSRAQDTGVQNVGSLYRELLAQAAGADARSGDAAVWAEESAGTGNELAAKWYASAARATGAQADELESAAAGLVTGERNRLELDRLERLGETERILVEKIQGTGARKLTAEEQQGAAKSTRSDIAEAEARLEELNGRDLEGELAAAEKRLENLEISERYGLPAYGIAQAREDVESIRQDIEDREGLPSHIEALKRAEEQLDSETSAVTYDSDYDKWSAAPYELQNVRGDYRQTQKNISFIEGEIEKAREQAEKDDLISGLQRSMERDGVTTEDYSAEYAQMQLKQKGKGDLERLFTDDTKENYTEEEYALLRYAQENYPASAEALEELYDTRADGRANERAAASVEGSWITDNFITNAAYKVAGTLASKVNAVDIGLQEIHKATGGRRFINNERTGFGTDLAESANERETERLGSYGTLNDLVNNILGTDADIPGIGGWTLGTLWQLATDTLISRANMLAFGPAAGLATGLQAGTSAQNEALEAGVDYDTARSLGIAAGINEGLGEQISIESFIGFGEKMGLFDSTGGRILLGLVVQPTNEGVQEGVTEWLNVNAEEYLLGYESEASQAERDYMEAGYDYETAQALAKRDTNDRIVQSALQGALGGALRSATGYIERAPGWAAESREHNAEVGGAILANGNAGDMARNISEFTGKTVKTAKTNRQATRQYEKFMEAAGAKISETMRAEDDQAVVDYYREARARFMESAGSAEKSAQAGQSGAESESRAARKKAQQEQRREGYLEKLLKKAASGETLSRQETFAVEHSDAARETFNAIQNNTLSVDRTKSDRQTTLARKVAGAIHGTTEGTSEGARAKAEKRAAGMKVSDEGASVDGERVKVNGIKRVAGENGDAVVTVTMPDGSARDVDINGITFSRQDAELYAYAADMAAPEAANAFRTLYTNNQNMARVANGMDAAYDMGRAGYRNMETVRKSALTRELTEQQLTTAYELGVKARAAAQEKIITEAAERAQAAMGSAWRGGRVTYDNVNPETLSAEQRRDAELAAVIAGLAGINVELFESQADESGRYVGENGSYNPKTNTIRLDVNAGRNYRGDSMALTALLKTMSHELTHDMQQNAPEEYARLRDAILDVLESQENADIDELADAKLLKDKSLKSREEALDEVVADACEGMLRDSDFAERMQQAHPEAARTLGEKLRELLGRIMDAIRAAFKGKRLSREAQLVMAQADEYRKIAELWAEGAVKAAEMTGRLQAERTETAQESLEPVEEAAETLHKATEAAQEEAVEKPVGTYEEPARPAEAHIDNRTWDSVADRSVQPFQNDYPAARLYMGAAAKALLQDARDSIPGKRFMTPDGEVIGQERVTTEPLGRLKDGTGKSWADIRGALKAMADMFENGDTETDIRNNALNKRIELTLDKMLTEGYTTLDGVVFNPDASYIAYKAELPGAAKPVTPQARDGGIEFGEYVRYQARAGYTEDGVPVYTSSFPEGSTRAERQARILQLVQDVWSKKPIKLQIERNGRTETITARFDPYVDPEGNINSDATKLAYGNRKGTMSDQKVTEKLADDFPEIISSSTYDHSTAEVGKNTYSHKDVVLWHYFANRIGFINERRNYAEYNVNVDVKEKADGDYVYSFAAVKRKGSERPKAPNLYGDPKTINASVKGIAPPIANTIIPADAGNVNPETRYQAREDVKFSQRDTSPEASTIREQIHENQELLNKMSPVFDGTTILPEINDKTSRINWALSELSRTGYSVERAGFGKIILDEKRIKKGLGYIHKNDTGRLAAVIAIPEVLRDGIEIGSHYDHKDRRYRTITFAAPVVINGQRGNLAVAVIQTNANNYRAHRILLPDGSAFIFNEKNAGSGTSSRAGNNPRLNKSTGSASANSIRQSAQEVNPELRYQERDPEQISDREILVRTVREGITDATEAQWLEGYLSQAEDLTKKQEELDGQRQIINETRALVEQARKAARKRAAELAAKSGLLPGERAQLSRYERIIRDMKDMPHRNARQQAIYEGARSRYAALREKSGLEAKEFEQWRDEKETADTGDELLTLTAAQRSRLHTARTRARILGDQLQRADAALLKLEAAKPLRQIVDRERAAAKAKADRRLKRYKDSEQLRTLRRRLSRKAAALDERLRHPKDGQYIPDGLREAARELDEMLLDANVGYAMEKDKSGARRLDRIRRELEAIGRENQNLAQEVDEELMAELEELSRLTEDKLISDMTAEELKTVENVIDHVNYLSSSAHSILLDGRRVKLETGAEEEKARMSGQSAKTRRGLSLLLKRLATDETTPIYFFRRLGGAFEKLAQGLFDGESEYGLMVSRAQRALAEIKERRHYDEWYNDGILEIVAENGGRLMLNREEALMLYATHKRETTNTRQDARHLTEGGVVERHTDRRIKGAELRERGVRLTENDLGKISGWLTEEQKAYADEVVAYMSGPLSEKLNEASRRMHGYSKFLEEYYFPYRVNRTHLPKNVGEAETMLIKSMGMSRRTVANANKPVELGEFTEMAGEHIQAALTYATLAPAQDDFMRLYNYRFDDGDTMAVKLTDAYGSDATRYITELMQDIYGAKARRGSLEDVAGRLTSRFKKNATAMSASVWLQQYTSLFRAWAVIGPQHFAGVQNPVKSWREATQYAGTAVIKEIGRFDTNVGRNVAEWITDKTEYRRRDRLGSFIDDAMGWIPERMDMLAWARLWDACKREQAAKTGLDKNSEELKRLAGRRMDEVVRLTQVYDSVFAKNAHMRNRSAAAKMLTAFGGEPAIMFNMLLEAAGNAKSNPGQLARTGLSLLASVIAVNLLASLAYAWRDDDEDETYAEKYVQALVSGMVSDLNPMGYLPLMSDVLSNIQGFTTERSDMAVISDLWGYVRLAFSEDAGGWDRLTYTIGALATAGGVPVKNIRRDVTGIWRALTELPDVELREGAILNAVKYGAAEGSTIAQLMGIEDTKKYNGEQLYEALLDGDLAEAEEYRKHLMLYNGAEDDDAVNSLLRSRIKEGYENGELDSGKAVDMLTEHAGMKRYDAEKRVAEWSYAVDTGTNYSDLKDEYLNGNLTDEEAIAARVEYGGADEQDAEATVAKWRYEKETGIAWDDLDEAYIAGELTAAEAQKAQTEYGGLDKADAEAAVKRWDFEKATGIAYADMKDAYISGELTEAEAIAARMEYGGVREAEARQTVAEWSYEKESGGEWSAMKADYIAGRMTGDEVVAAQVKYGGAFEKDVRAQLLKWDYERDTGMAYTDMKDAYLEGEIGRKDAVAARMKYGGLDAEAAELDVSRWDFEQDYGYSYDDMRDYYELGSISYDEAVAARVKYGKTEEDKAYFTVAGWEYEQETGGEWEGKFTKIHDAVDSGSSADLRSSIQEVYDHSAYDDGKKAASAVTSNITSTYKSIYLAATPAQRAAMEPRLLEAYRLAYELAGEEYYGDSYKLKQIRKWAED